jgi:uncharacterized membrane protein YesL
MKSIAVTVFKIFIVIIILFNLLLRMASEHEFMLPLEEMFGYLSMIMAFALLSFLPSVNKNWLKTIKYLTVVFLLGVIGTSIYLSMTTFKVDYENWFIGFLFHLWDISFLFISVYVLFLVLTDRLLKNDNNVRNELGRE